MAAPTRRDLEDAAVRFFDRLVSDVDQPRDYDLDQLDQHVDEAAALWQDRIADLDGQLVIGVYDKKIRVLAAEMVRLLGVELESLEPAKQATAMYFAARAEREQGELFVHRLREPGREFEHRDDLFEGRREFAAATSTPPFVEALAPAELSPTLGDVVSRYLKRKTLSGLSQSQVQEVRRALRWLQEVVPPTRPFASIQKRELASFRDDVSRIDVTLRGRAAPFHDRLTNVAKNQVKSVTALRYWKSVQAFFAWAASEGFLEASPAASLRLEMRKGEVKRTPPPFTTEELQRLFQTPLFAGYKSVKRVSTPGTCRRREGHWWSAVLLMFTGLRAGELSQLLSEDFDFDGDVPLLRVRPEDHAGKRVKSTKNAASVRDVPLAKPLMTLGLREFVRARAKRGPGHRVFYEMRLGQNGRLSDGMTRFWADYLRCFGLWKQGRGTHVWRHTVVACLRKNDVSSEDIAAFVGHSQRTMTSQYGGDYPLTRKAQTAAQLDYGFDVVTDLGGPYAKLRH